MELPWKLSTLGKQEPAVSLWGDLAPLFSRNSSIFMELPWKLSTLGQQGPAASLWSYHTIQGLSTRHSNPSVQQQMAALCSYHVVHLLISREGRQRPYGVTMGTLAPPAFWSYHQQEQQYGVTISRNSIMELPSAGTALWSYQQEQHYGVTMET